MSFKVDVGKIYEIVVTTWDGLYRYRTEDLVEVIGFYGTIPKYQFVRRLVYYSPELPSTNYSSYTLSKISNWSPKILASFGSKI